MTSIRIQMAKATNELHGGINKENLRLQLKQRLHTTTLSIAHLYRARADMYEASDREIVDKLILDQQIQMDKLETSLEALDGN